MKLFRSIAFFLSAAAVALTSPAVAAATTAAGSITITLKDHRFTPAAFAVAAGEKVRIVLVNQDAATEEFDSHDLKVEKLVTPNGRATFSIGPLKPGSYSFMGEFHPRSAQGRVTVQEARP